MQNPPKTPDPALKNWTPYASDVENMGVNRQPLGGFAPRSVAALAYKAVWNELKAGMKINKCTWHPIAMTNRIICEIYRSHFTYDA